MFKLFSKGDQLKIKLTNLKFSKIGNGPKFLLFGGFSNRGKALSICYPLLLQLSRLSGASAAFFSISMNRLMQDGDIERMQPLVPIPKCVLSR